MSRTKAAHALGERLAPQKQTLASQSDLARALGVTPQSVSNWVNGQSKPAPENMRRIEDLLGIPMRDWTEPEESSPVATTADDEKGAA